MKIFNVFFAGTPAFAVPSLAALIADARFNVVGVLTQPDRPAGRGQKLQASPVKLLATEHQLPVWQPSTLKDPEIQEILKNLAIDVMVVAAYGLLLPQAVLDIPNKGCINVHGSILPRWRGAAPVQRAIEAGDTTTGITIMQMEKGLDTGPMFHRKRCNITDQDTGASLMEKLAHLGAEALSEALPQILHNQLHAIAQNHDEATYAKKLEKAEGLLDWQQDATFLERKIRAFYPWPGCYFNHHGQVIKVGRAQVVTLENGATPGSVISCDKTKLVIACGQHALSLVQIQLPGNKMQAATHYLQSAQILELFFQA